MSVAAEDRNANLREVAAQRALDDFRQQATQLFERQRDRTHQLEKELACQIEAAIEAIDFSDAFLAEREEQLADLESKLTILAEERDEAIEARREAESLLGEVPDVTSAEPSTAGMAEMASLQAECDELRQALDEARAQLAVAESTEFLESVELDALRQRCESALEEVRDLKQRNRTLNEQVSTPNSHGRARRGETDGSFDWEAEKRLLLQQLEADVHSADSVPAGDRMAVEDAIRVTDQAIVEKDREIDELKRQLEEQAKSVRVEDAESTQIAEILDHDQVVCEERARLQQQQEEWRDKLREAEIEISVERARLSRERMELQGQLRSMEQHGANRPATPVRAKSVEKPSLAGWRKRLGLKDR